MSLQCYLMLNHVTLFDFESFYIILICYVACLFDFVRFFVDGVSGFLLSVFCSQQSGFKVGSALTRPCLVLVE